MTRAAHSVFSPLNALESAIIDVIRVKVVNTRERTMASATNPENSRNTKDTQNVETEAAAPEFIYINEDSCSDNNDDENSVLLVCITAILNDISINILVVLSCSTVG